MAGWEGPTLGFVSSHGTGTPLGDPIEFGAMQRALAAAAGAGAGAEPLVVGGIKPLVGHLEGSAGLAGAFLAVAHLLQRCTQALGYRNLNPYVAQASIDSSPLARLPLQVTSNRMHLVLFGMQNRTFGAIWKPCIGFSLKQWQMGEMK
jgi:acyl transferase domain-containing protein